MSALVRVESRSDLEHAILCVSRALRAIKPFAQGSGLRVSSLLLAGLLCTLSGAGCLRFGYGDREVRDDAGRDSGLADAGKTPSGGSGGEPGSSGDGGSRDSGAGADGGVGDSDAGVILMPMDAGPDADAMVDPVDAAAADGGPPVISPLCPERPGALFCDGFEDPDFGRWEFGLSTNGMLERSTERAYSGATSLLATTGPAAHGTEARRATYSLEHQRSGDAWLRFYNWVPGTVVVTEHFSVGLMGEIEVPWDGFELRILPSLVDINAANRIFPGTLSFPRDQWVCVELHVRIDPSVGIFEAYLDGQLAVRSPHTH